MCVGVNCDRASQTRRSFSLLLRSWEWRRADCFVVEDAPTGIEAAPAGGMFALGIARLGDADLLRAAGADLVVTSLDEVKVDELIGGRLCRPAT